LKITGGTVTVTPSAAAASLLSTNGVAVTPVAPATVSGGAFTFPIAGGRLTRKSLHGVIRERGGLDISNASETVNLRHLRLLSNHSGVSLYATVRRHPAACVPYAIPHKHGKKCRNAKGLRVAKVARITGVHVSGTSATGTVRVTASTAAIVNHLAGQHIVSVGAVLGTTTISPTLG
jgi:hypothetical protein